MVRYTGDQELDDALNALSKMRVMVQHIHDWARSIGMPAFAHPDNPEHPDNRERPTKQG